MALACPTRVSHKGAPQECARTVLSVPQDLQKCPTRVTRVSHETVPRECRTRLSVLFLTRNKPAHQRHANGKRNSTKAAPSRMAQRHHGGSFAAARHRLWMQLSVPKWHGVTHMHFPPMPCQTAMARQRQGRISAHHVPSSKKSRVKSRKRVFGTRRPPNLTSQVSKTSVYCLVILRNTHEVSKTSIWYETSSKTHALSL